MIKLNNLCLVVMGFMLLGLNMALADDVPFTAWGTQFSLVEGMKISADSFGNSFLAGTCDDSLGISFSGKRDAFIRKFDPNGVILWTLQLGTSAIDYGKAIAVDQPGNCFIVGTTKGAFNGTNLGKDDAFIAKVNKDGAVKWVRQLGTSGTETATGVAVDPQGNSYIFGATNGNMGGTNAGSYDTYLAKFDTSGNQVWLKQNGSTTAEYSSFLTVNKGERMVAMLSDRTIQFYDQQGNLKSSFKSSINTIGGIAADEQNNVYLGGNTGSCAVITKCDTTGKKLWEKTFCGNQFTGIWGVTRFWDDTGDIAVGGCGNWPTCEAFARRYDANGNLKFYYGVTGKTTEYPCGEHVAVDGYGNFFVAGNLKGDLFGNQTTTNDRFLAKIAVTTQTGIKESSNVTTQFELEQNFPNPFNPVTKISYSLSKASAVKLVIYNISGQQVRLLVDQYQHSGRYSYEWNATDDFGKEVSSGIYLYKLSDVKTQVYRKMLLVR
jgi:hypothetical protein